MINGSGCRYLILVDTGCIPNFLHYLDRLLDGDIPRISGFTDECHVGCDKLMSEPMCFNPVWKLLISGFFGRFTGLCRLLSYKFLENYLCYCIRLREKKNTSLVIRFFPLGGLLIATSRSSPLISSLSDRPPLLYKDRAG